MVPGTFGAALQLFGSEVIRGGGGYFFLLLLVAAPLVVVTARAVRPVARRGLWVAWGAASAALFMAAKLTTPYDVFLFDAVGWATLATLAAAVTAPVCLIAFVPLTLEAWSRDRDGVMRKAALAASEEASGRHADAIRRGNEELRELGWRWATEGLDALIPPDQRASIEPTNAHTELQGRLRALREAAGRASEREVVAPGALREIADARVGALQEDVEQLELKIAFLETVSRLASTLSNDEMTAGSPYLSAISSARSKRAAPSAYRSSCPPSAGPIRRPVPSLRRADRHRLPHLTGLQPRRIAPFRLAPASSPPEAPVAAPAAALELDAVLAARQLRPYSRSDRHPHSTRSSSRARGWCYYQGIGAPAKKIRLLPSPLAGRPASSLALLQQQLSPGHQPRFSGGPGIPNDAWDTACVTPYSTYSGLATVCERWTSNGNCASGSIVGRNLVLTCSHGLWERDWDDPFPIGLYPAPCDGGTWRSDLFNAWHKGGNDSWSGMATVDPNQLRLGQWNAAQKWGIIKVIGVYFVEKHSSDFIWPHDSGSDWAILVTEQPIGDHFGYLGFRPYHWWETPGYYKNIVFAAVDVQKCRELKGTPSPVPYEPVASKTGEVEIVAKVQGPKPEPAGMGTGRVAYQLASSGWGTFSVAKLGSEVVITHYFDKKPGMSGGILSTGPMLPVSQATAFAVHSTDTGPGTSQAAGIGQDLHDALWTAIHEEEDPLPPVQYSDLAKPYGML